MTLPVAPRGRTMFWHLAPLVAVLTFYGVGFGWRAWLQRRRYGGSGIVLFRSGRRAQDAREALFILLATLLLAEASLAALSPGRLAWLGTLPLPAAEVLRPVGLALVLAGTAVMVKAQLDLGASWRVGIDEGARPGLVSRGLYRFSRNPIFLGMLLALAGFTLLLPTWLSLALLVGGYFIVHRHVADEEAYLARAYGEEYRAYASRVGRFVPGLGLMA
jgi:protein-S-isoprenylcysteine O-methyltransferase Ste14